jgi:hypothetical protein
MKARVVGIGGDQLLQNELGFAILLLLNQFTGMDKRRRTPGDVPAGGHDAAQALEQSGLHACL